MLCFVEMKQSCSTLELFQKEFAGILQYSEDFWQLWGRFRSVGLIADFVVHLQKGRHDDDLLFLLMSQINKL